ncbi:GNAT family N-acetyltransferase [Flavobacterium sp.]|uniref:GNAT family N-acetyltransferase n=1 Tax=Flavobacterium sp. TaxID=239 RepID=UPI00286C7E88|nr:GNAT family N-acetyltransferase [Flavobacterium sp.]
MKILETNRLYLRPMTVDDAENIHALNLDPEVIQFTGDEAFENVESAKIFLENYDHYTQYGFGRWAVIEKESEAFLGWCGLKYTPELDAFDIGFRFFKKYWNKGYATESAAACIDLGFNQYKMPKIVGRSRTENKASIKVLEKIGLTYSGVFDFDGHEGVIYSIEK